MRQEICKFLDQYSESWFSSFSKLVPSNMWGQRRCAEAFLNKYYLAEDEYNNIWQPKQKQIFLDNFLPDLIYTEGYEMLALRGGCLFVEDDFKQFQQLMQDTGDEYFVVIQHSQEYTKGEPMFRMKFPMCISWQELLSGNYISAILFEMPYNEYFVFGDSGIWGKYSANDYIHPLDIIGFKPGYASLFHKNFATSREEHDEIHEWLPRAYKKLIK